MSYHEAKRQRDLALLRALGLLQDESPPAKPEGAPNFDGGVRETPPLQGNPEQDHNALILQMLGEHPGGSGAEFWSMGGPPARSGSEREVDPHQDDGDWRKGGT